MSLVGMSEHLDKRLKRLQEEFEYRGIELTPDIRELVSFELIQAMTDIAVEIHKSYRDKA